MIGKRERKVGQGGQMDIVLLLGLRALSERHLLS